MKSELQNKGIDITNLVEYLFQKYGKENFKVKDHWEDDNCAIGLTDVLEKYLIYISTIGLNNKGYFASLENASTDEVLMNQPENSKT